MIAEALQNTSTSAVVDRFMGAAFDTSRRRTAESYERELAQHRRTEQKLRDALTHETASNDEFVHRLLNGLQMIGSLLSLQSRASANAEIASQLAVAANRVGMISRIHRSLASLEGRRTVAFKSYLEELCVDYRTMLSSDERSADIIVEGADLDLPTKTAIPLALIANELITNAAKYGTGQTIVTLEEIPAKGRALSVRNDGTTLPENFDPTVATGLGMKIIRAFVAEIGDQLTFGPADNGQGACFTVSFP